MLEWKKPETENRDVIFHKTTDSILTWESFLCEALLKLIGDKVRILSLQFGIIENDFPVYICFNDFTGSIVEEPSGESLHHFLQIFSHLFIRFYKVDIILSFF